MGEYAVRKSDGERVKIGTCESMYYLRFEDRFNVSQEPNSLDAGIETNLFWRLPYPDEDNVPIGQYEVYNRGERLYKQEDGNHFCEDFADPSTVDYPGIIQLTHPSGLLVNVPCFHGEKLPEGGEIKTAWNGKSWFYELAFIKNLPDGSVWPVVHCRHCGKMWRYSWEEVLPYLHGKIKDRLSVYATAVTE